jgi:hypothetical protein
VSNFAKSVSKISVPVLTGDFITVKSASWYVHNFDNFFKNVHNNVRKWPNLCSVRPWIAWRVS